MLLCLRSCMTHHRHCFSTVWDAAAVVNAVHILVADKACESAAAIPAIAFANNNTTILLIQTFKSTYSTPNLFITTIKSERE